MKFYVLPALRYVDLADVPFVDSLVVEVVALAEAILKYLDQVVAVGRF